MSADTEAEKINFKSFAESTTLHGVQYFSQKISALHKLAWTIILLTVTGFCIYSITDIVLQYLRKESYCTTTREAETSMEYPALTICNLSPFNYSALFKFSPILFKFFRKPEEFQPDTDALHELSQKNLLETFAQTGFSIEETFVMCGLGINRAGLIPCRDYVTPLLNDKGMCYTFNGRKIAQRLKATGARMDQGIRIMLDTNSEAFFLSEESGEGFILAIHDPDEMPSMAARTMLLRPGDLTHVGITKVITEHLKKPYSQEDCLTDTTQAEQDLYGMMKYYNMPYSKDLCYMKCLVYDMAFENTCFVHPSGSDCTWLKYMTTAYNNLRAMKGGKIESDKLCNHCLANCTTTSYMTTASYAGFPNPETQQEISLYRPQYNSVRKMQANLVDVIVYYEKLETTTVRQVPSISPSQLWSNVGGLLGLTLGASFITVAEFLDFLLMLIISKCSREKK